MPCGAGCICTAPMQKKEKAPESELGAPLWSSRTVRGSVRGEITTGRKHDSSAGQPQQEKDALLRPLAKHKEIKCILLKDHQHGSHHLWFFTSLSPAHFSLQQESDISPTSRRSEARRPPQSGLKGSELTPPSAQPYGAKPHNPARNPLPAPETPASPRLCWAAPHSQFF